DRIGAVGGRPDPRARRRAGTAPDPAGARGAAGAQAGLSVLSFAPAAPADPDRAAGIARAPLGVRRQEGAARTELVPARPGRGPAAAGADADRDGRAGGCGTRRAVMFTVFKDYSFAAGHA